MVLKPAMCRAILVCLVAAAATLALAGFRIYRCLNMNIGQGYNQIEIGMTADEVEQAMGGPEGDYSLVGMEKAYRESFAIEPDMPRKRQHWISDDHYVEIVYGYDDRVRITGIEDYSETPY